MTVTLDPELAEYVKTKLDDGTFRTASEVVNEGLRLLQAQEIQRILDGVDMEEVRRKVRMGLGQSQRGESVEWDEAFRHGVRERGLKALEEEKKRG